MIDFADLDTNPNAQRPASSVADIRKAAHIANGGDAASHDCPRCHGTGRFRGYARTFPCNKCGATGKVSRGVASAAKGKITREQNAAAWMAQHDAEIAYIRQRAEKGSAFYVGILDAVLAYGTLSENRLSAVHKDMAADAERREQRREVFAAERRAKSGTVDISGIAKLFATATDNDIKRPIFRAEGIEISKAPAHGANAGALYIKSNDGAYLGKIVGGSQFMASREAPADTLIKLQAVAADPTAEAIKYARRTGRCSCCGRDLVDPISIRAGIGPICAERWGLDYRRELAAQELAGEA